MARVSAPYVVEYLCVADDGVRIMDTTPDKAQYIRVRLSSMDDGVTFMDFPANAQGRHAVSTMTTMLRFCFEHGRKDKAREICQALEML